MDTKALEKFAQTARRQLHEQVRAKLERVLHTDSAELRASSEAVAELNQQIAISSRDAVVERVAYTWFNRFCALRYMDANRYTRMGVVSPAPGFTQPEILQEAKQSHIDEALAVDQQRIFDLLAERVPSTDPQQEAYRLLLVAVCNDYHRVMPYMFERINDYTELLMPDDLLSSGSILQAAREVLTEEACQDVEVIGWLYQFYISERKDEVIGSKKQIQPKDIPAATQLFTPHWIVRYLVENSLGRLWLLNKPHSRLAEHMDYYIKPQQQETDLLRVNSPEELTVCDPAVGSGHMLTYAFDLLYAIYEEEGYNPPDIPRLILEKNLTGLEIDERAGALAAFALTMKARGKDRRFLRRDVRPQIMVLHPPVINQEELQRAGWLRDLGRTLLDLPVQNELVHDLGLLKQVDNIGSLLCPKLTPEQIALLRERISAGTDLFSHTLNTQVLEALAQLAPLVRRYHVVVANPPYMGGRGMNDALKKFAKDQYPDSKSDLFAMFMERNLAFARQRGYVAMITMQSWMFLSSYEKLRAKLLKQHLISGMAHLGARAFDTIGGEVVSTTAFVLENTSRPDATGDYMRLVDGNSEAEKETALREAIRDPQCGWFYRASAVDFQKIPGSPIAYWVSEKVFKAFALGKELKTIGDTRQGMATSDNNRFLRAWQEVSRNRCCFAAESHQTAEASGKKWFPYNKGGEFRKWYGNSEFLVNWAHGGKELLDYAASKYGSPTRTIKSISEYFKPCISWSKISSGNLAMRYYPIGYLFDVAGCSVFSSNNSELLYLLGFTNSFVVREFLAAISPTLNFEAGHIAKLPVLEERDDSVSILVRELVSQEKRDWDSYESSWDFTALPILHNQYRCKTLVDSYIALRNRWQENTRDVLRLEEENNCFFINAYGLVNELSSIIPVEEITLTCNPHSRYGGNRTDDELEVLLKADTMREFISYAVGCMVGRYSLDKPGLILANQGETVEDYYRIVGLALDAVQFVPDRDNVLPILDGDWFPDDIVGRFKRFLRVTFGVEYFEENLAFIENALGRDIRSYFLREFYNHHVKMYKKRPIYWLFSSPNGSFNALIYMHRYRPDTVSVILNDYLRDFRAKLTAQKAHLQQVERSPATPQRDKTRALKEIVDIDKILNELREYEDEVLYPLATRQVHIDLDDGVKVNYNKFGAALKKFTGLSN